MRPQDLEREIRFTERKIGKFELVVEGSLLLRSAKALDDYTLRASKGEIMEYVRRNIVTDIMGMLYDDSSREAYLAIMDLMSVDPYDITKRDDAKGRLMKLAQRLNLRPEVEPAHPTPAAAPRMTAAADRREDVK